MVTTITEVLNTWNELGVFSYVLPFLLIFAVIFAILEKSRILGDNKTIGSIVAASIGLLALQFDFVSEFFAIIFPRFGIGISIFIVLIISIGFFFKPGNLEGRGKWIGYTVGLGAVIWALSVWDEWSGTSGAGGWFVENVWSIIVLAVIISVIVIAAKSGKESGGSSSTTPS